MKQTVEPFEELFIPRRDIEMSDTVLYRVYSDPKYFETIAAASALEAMGLSKIKNVYKVQRHDPLADNVIHLRNKSGAAVSATVPQEVAFDSPLPDVASQEAEVVPVEQETGDLQETGLSVSVIGETPASESAQTSSAGLSNEEVEKLLNGG